MSLFLPVGILVFAGLLAISSVAPALFSLQLMWVALGVGILAIFYFFDWRILLTYRWFTGALYIFSVALLTFVYFFGPETRGVRGWITFGPLNFQPVELMKVALILLYAGYFSRKHWNISRWSTIARSFVFFAVPAALVALQPDLGSATILFGIWFGFIFLSGFSGKRLLLLLFIFIIAAVLMWFYFLADYQQARITGLFFPERDALGVNYSTAQSKIAIGSAGFFGKGYGQGSQGQLGFLTEPESDFVLAAIIEEWGIFGGAVAIAAFLALIAAIMRTGLRAERNFEKFLCLGVVVVFGLQFMLNGGSTLGLMPVVGVTYPFVSYGGSSMVTNFFLLGLINAIKRKQT
ncbi:MAG: FtsW/RodA/SpoVE family cell cycle protein [Patescibacteria group bacterium]